jgi:hypothetical protein
MGHRRFRQSSHGLQRKRHKERIQKATRWNSRFQVDHNFFCFIKISFRQLIEATGAYNNNCELDTLQLQLFVEDIINSFLSFFKQKKLSNKDIAKGRAAFRLFISAWQWDIDNLGEIISKSYLSAVMKICGTTMPAGKYKFCIFSTYTHFLAHRDFTVFHLLTEVTLCKRVNVKSHERSECISRLNMLYKNGVFPTLRIPIKTIIARLFDMMGLNPTALHFPLRDSMPVKCVAYNLEDNKENLVICYDMEVIRACQIKNLTFLQV